MSARYIGSGFFVDDSDPEKCVAEDGSTVWLMPFAAVLSGERIDYGMAATDTRHPQSRNDLMEEYSAPSAPMVLNEPFNALVTDGESIADIAKEIDDSAGAVPFYVENTPLGWINNKSDYKRLADAYGLDPDRYAGPGVYDFRDLDKYHDTHEDFEIASAEFWVDEAIEFMFQGDDADTVQQQLIEELILDCDEQSASKKKRDRRKGPGFEFLN